MSNKEGKFKALKAPFIYFGGKKAVAHIIWERLGDPINYVEPFMGSLAVPLGRPHEAKTETFNDIDGFLCNAWRAIQNEPLEVAKICSSPVFESDLTAKHVYLVERRDELTSRLEADPDYYDVKLAGYWIWGICCWIGSGFCSGKGPWKVVDGRLLKVGNGRLKRQLPHLGNRGQGVNRQLPHLGNRGRGVNKSTAALMDWMEDLSDRLISARIACGDWKRVMGSSVTEKIGLTGIFLDPPYGHLERTKDVYALDNDVASEVLEWCIANGNNPKLRICLAGYEGEHNTLEELGWEKVVWRANGGYGNQQADGKARENAKRECLWFSPHCLKPIST
jgi:DNA adenine methylase